MARELLLLRHGKSDWSVSVGDYDRPLKKRGKKGAQLIGSWLKQQEILPDLIWSSSAERAISTAERCLKSLGLSSGLIHSTKGLYLADLEDLLKMLSGIDETAQRVMIVGHNPGLEELVSHLLGERCPSPDDGKLIPTATIAHIKLPNCWNKPLKGKGKLMQLIRARDLSI